MRNAVACCGGGGRSSRCPADLRDADGIGRIIGRPPGAQSTLEEDYLRVARRSRAATDQNFYQGRQD